MDYELKFCACIPCINFNRLNGGMLPLICPRTDIPCLALEPFVAGNLRVAADLAEKYAEYTSTGMWLPISSPMISDEFIDNMITTREVLLAQGIRVAHDGTIKIKKGDNQNDS